MTKLLIGTLLLCGLASAETPEDSSSKARVFIYEARVRGLRPNPIFCDGLQVASLRHKWSYFVLQLQPGEHAFRGRYKGNELVLDLSAGRDYFLRLDNGDVLHEKLTRESAEEGRLTAATVTSGKLKPIEPTDVNDQLRVSLTFSPVHSPKEQQH